MNGIGSHSSWFVAFGVKSHILTLLSTDPLTNRPRLNCKHVTNDVWPLNVDWHLGSEGFAISQTYNNQKMILSLSFRTFIVVSSEPETTFETDGVNCTHLAQLPCPVSDEMHCFVVRSHICNVLRNI